MRLNLSVVGLPLRSHPGHYVDTERIEQYKSISEYNLKKETNPGLLEPEHNAPHIVF